VTDSRPREEYHTVGWLCRRPDAKAKALTTKDTKKEKPERVVKSSRQPFVFFVFFVVETSS
jgi:hypothetical protein